MSQKFKTELPRPAKAMTRTEELVAQLTNKHAQQRAVKEWQALIELAKMDGTTVNEAFAQVRDVVEMRRVLALEAIAGELHAISQGVANHNLLQELLHPELFEKEEVQTLAPEGDGEAVVAEDPELPETESAVGAEPSSPDVDKTPAGTQVVP